MRRHQGCRGLVLQSAIQMAADFLTFVFMVKIEKNDAVVRNGLAVAALFFAPPVFFAAEGTPVVNQSIIAPADIFLESSLVQAVHLAVRLFRVLEEPIDDGADALVSLGVLLFYLLQPTAETIGGQVNVLVVFHNGTKQPGFPVVVKGKVGASSGNSSSPREVAWQPAVRDMRQSFDKQAPDPYGISHLFESDQ